GIEQSLEERARLAELGGALVERLLRELPAAHLRLHRATADSCGEEPGHEEEPRRQLRERADQRRTARDDERPAVGADRQRNLCRASSKRRRPFGTEDQVTGPGRGAGVDRG